MSEQPKVSVCIVTYNHEAYIEHALLSALRQRTRFPFEVIVGDDGSSDRTAEVIRQVAQRHPELRVIAHPRNIGVTENYLSVHDSARGEYVAHLDGDDAFLPGKLQAQATFMDAHPECSISWHPLICFDEVGEHYIIGNHGPLVAEVLGRPDIGLSDALVAYGVGGYHSSSMYRRSSRVMYAYPHPFLIDYRITLSLLENGNGRHMKRVLGCYRAFRDQSATRGGTDFVGPGLLRTLEDYAGDSPELDRAIASHCASAFLYRTVSQARMIELLFQRLTATVTAPTAAPPRVFRGGTSLSRRLRGQIGFFANTLRFVASASKRGTLPDPVQVQKGLRVTAFLSRPGRVATGFFSRGYGRQLTLASP